MKFIIKLDKEAVSKNDQFELNDRDIFKRLAESNELVKYLIQEFGAEPGL
ncbi:MAG: hypothetical protein SFU91_08490 [Chloroherpetonaceae bacterium]|nr:hypothetical protein [Chloroherpetonaceae bacterium]